MNSCYICECVFGPKALVEDVNELQSFNGYMVDFRLRQFRKIPLDALPEFIDFDSPQGLQLCAAMHDAAMNQLNEKFANTPM